MRTLNEWIDAGCELLKDTDYLNTHPLNSLVSKYSGEFEIGDVNFDGKVGFADKSQYSKFLLGLVKLKIFRRATNQNDIFDINSNGKYDICDLVFLVKQIAQIE